jgi:alkaline phosphatase D
MLRLFFSFLTLCTFATLGFAQKNLLQSGPMLGHVDMREATLWAQTKKAATVQFEYWPTTDPKRVHRTEKIKTTKHEGFTAKCVADEVEPGVEYTYRLRINGKKVPLPYATTFKTQTLWQWRTDPPAFTLLTGSCNYVNEPRYDRPGQGYGNHHRIFGSMAQLKPDLMLWLGDNTYLREPDWGTRTGMLHRYTHDRALPELQAFLASTSHYAIWDDHDFGPNDSDGTWVQKETSLDVFRLFWANPTFGVGGVPSCATQFKYTDVDFFLLDNRYFRTPDECEQCPDDTQLGVPQREWLLAALAASRAPFKIVAIGGQFLTTNESHETYAHYNRAERDTILARIERENIKNVIFLTGDRHFAELSSYTNARGNVLYDLTASPLTSGNYAEAAKEKNDRRVPGTLYPERNFAALRFSGPRTNRQLDITLYGTDGQEIWKHSIVSQK